MTSIRELRHRVMSMDSADCRNELDAALGLLDRLEADFATLALEVAALCYDRNREAYNTSREFDQMCERRGIEFP